MRPNTFQAAYRHLLTEIHHHGIFETNERTSTGIKMIEGGWSFKIKLDKLPIAGNRKYYPRIAAAETAWQLLGTQDPAFILKYAPKMWSKFVEDGLLKAAYGYRWSEHFGRDQIKEALTALQEEPTNRQIFVSAWDPAEDGLGRKGPKNIPCPVGFSLSRTSDKLNCSVFLRSSDVFVGLPYDVMNYALLTDVFASTLGVKPGFLHVTLAHPHIYEPHFQALKDCIEGEHLNWISDCEPIIPARWNLKEVIEDPEGYVARVTDLTKFVNSNSWDPKPMVVE